MTRGISKRKLMSIRFVLFGGSELPGTFGGKVARSLFDLVRAPLEHKCWIGNMSSPLACLLIKFIKGSKVCHLGPRTHAQKRLMGNSHQSTVWRDVSSKGEIDKDRFEKIWSKYSKGTGFIKQSQLQLFVKDFSASLAIRYSEDQVCAFQL